MYRVYATEPRARINIGIRRRLAPLMENDRRRIELLTGLLMSMPGTPIIYYGDEIGMGDNIYLTDRDGVRTPMQWSIDRNGGFSRADAQRLFLPVIQDPVYGYTSVNVETQMRSSWSLLNWMKRLIAVRRAHKVFGRGSIAFLHPENRKVLAYVREYEGETVLCVANLSNAPQFVSLDLSRYVGSIPIEMLGWSAFAPIVDDRYVLTMQRYAFFWFMLSPDPVAREVLQVMPEFLTLVLPAGWRSLTRDPARARLEREILPAFFPTKRWFAAKNAVIASAAIVDVALLDDDPQGQMLFMLSDVRLEGGNVERYLTTPALGLETGGDYPATVLSSAYARYRTGAREGMMYDASQGDDFWLVLASRMREGARIRAENGKIVAETTESFRAVAADAFSEVQRVQAEQSNSSAIVNGKVMLKVYRRLQSGTHPEIEMSRFLLRAGYANTPRFLGALTYEAADGSFTALGVAHEFVLNQGDGWRVTLTFLKAFLERRFEEDPLEIYSRYARRLGKRLAELHAVLRSDREDPAFAPEEAGNEELSAWGNEIAQMATANLDLLEFSMPAIATVAEEAQAVLQRRHELISRIGQLAAQARPTIKTRIHGDFHLGQVLVVTEDVFIVDLEGETQLQFERRRRKQSQLRDVAGMLRSFDYAAVHSLVAIGPDRFAEEGATVETDIDNWKRRAVGEFLAGYEETSGSRIDGALLELFLIGKALYELGYELSNRPTWVHIPLRGLLSILQPEPARR